MALQDPGVHKPRMEGPQDMESLCVLGGGQRQVSQIQLGAEGRQQP